MFSKNITNIINHNFEKQRDIISKTNPDYLEKIESYNEKMKILLKFYYAYMPVEDMLAYPINYFESYAENAIELYYERLEKYNFSSDKEKDNYDAMFLNYVAFHRSNNEDFVRSRNFKFGGELKARIAGLSDYEAVKEINYWCSEYVTYKAGDDRTSSAMTTFKSGIGRCGEESVFLVEVLRANGFIARQVYSPFWSHCDDNHAWVEVYIDDDWYYLGACEPEEVLDKGWFSAAAKRAPIVRAMIFTDLIGEEEVIGNNSFASFVNATKHYARTRDLCVKVVDELGNPVSECGLFFEVLNYSAYKCVANKITDENGFASINIGYGNLNIRAVKDGIYTNYLLGENETDVRIVLKNNESKVFMEKDFVASKDNYDLESSKPDYALKYGLEKDKKWASASLRETRVKTREENALAKYEQRLEVTSYNDEGEKLKNVYIESAGNLASLQNFLDMGGEKSDLDLKVSSLLLLAKKDYRDFDFDILYKHMKYVQKFRDNFTDEVFKKGLLGIRIAYEYLSDYAPEISKLLSDEQKRKFKDNPTSIAYYVDEIIKDTDDNIRFYPYLRILPKMAVKHGILDKKDREFLVVAIARALGVPAYLRDYDGAICLYIDGEFRAISDNKYDEIRITFENGEKLVYPSDFSISRIDDGLDYPLELDKFDFGKTLQLERGRYRLITSNRLPNGNLLAREIVFNSEDTNEISISKRTYELKDMLVNYELPKLSVFDDKKEKVLLRDILKEDYNIVFWMKSSSEPSEHIYNELIDLGKIRDDVTIISDSLSEKENLSKVSNSIYFDFDDYNLNILERLTYNATETYPLALVVDASGKVRFATCGYNVGVVGVLIDIKNILLVS